MSTGNNGMALNKNKKTIHNNKSIKMQEHEQKASHDGTLS